MKPREAVLFDLDDTLLDGSYNVEAVRETCALVASLHPTLDVARLIDANSAAWSAYWPEVASGWELGTVGDNEVGYEAWRRTLALCGCFDEELARLARRTHVERSRSAFRLFDDVRGVLDQLRGRWVTAVITNGSRDTQRDKLRVVGVEHRFDMVVVSAEVGVAKPDPAIFEMTLELLGVKREKSWHVGDSLSRDVAGANAAGIHSVWLNRTGAAQPPGIAATHVVRTLNELPALLGVT